ncbi:UvrD/REP helicase [Micrococcus luteus SK58]|nr:UvrD/REP helicase [Micrococcus luteus SK58]
MADLFSALGRTPLNLDRTRRPADPETALPGLVPPAVTRVAADPEAWGEDARPAAPAHTPESLVAGLNPQQAAAVTHTGAPLLIVAGAGSGKTRVLTHRIAWLLATGRARPHEILAITFTNKAAAEMRERVAGLIGPTAQRMWISTFHSSAVRLLRNEAANIGLKSTFTIYDSADSLRLVTTVAKQHELDPKRFAPKALLNRISSLKNELVEADDYAATVAEGDPWGRAVAAVYRGYTARLRQANALDFDDLIGMTVHMFEAFPRVLDNYRRRFRHVLVDEYQDTNHAQYRLIRLLAGPAGDPEGVETPGGELTVVGDSDQSIYAFRGADIRNIVEFEQDFTDAVTIKLEQNYRSTQTILDAANAVIERNPDRRPKRLWTAEGEGPAIVGYAAENESAEAEWIASTIDRLQDEDGIRPADVAVFYRTNAQSRALEERLVTRGIPYRVIGGTRFYDRKEIKDALAYLRVIVNPDDDVNVRRILNEPKRGIGDRAEGAVAAWAERNRSTFSAALRDAENAPGMAARSLKAVRGFVQMMDDLGQVAESAGPATVLEAVLEQSGMLAALRESEDLQDESRADNLGELVAVVRSFETTHPDGTLSDFLEQVALVADADQLPTAPDVEGEALAEQQGQVTLMTLHTAKGLEFRRVPDGHGARGVPARPLDDGREGARGGASPGLRGPDARPPSPVPDARRGTLAVGPAPVQPAQPVPRGDPGGAHRLGAGGHHALGRLVEPDRRRHLALRGAVRGRAAGLAVPGRRRRAAPAPHPRGRAGGPHGALRRGAGEGAEPGAAAEGDRGAQPGRPRLPRDLRRGARGRRRGRRGQDRRDRHLRRHRGAEAAAAALRPADEGRGLTGPARRPPGLSAVWTRVSRGTPPSAALLCPRARPGHGGGVDVGRARGRGRQTLSSTKKDTPPWTCMSTRRAICSRRTASPCWPASLRRPRTRPRRPRRRSAASPSSRRR